MERFLPSAGGSSAAGLRPCGEPTCQQKSQLVSAVHQCPCGRSMHAFCGRGIGEEGYGQQRECSDCQKSKGGDQAGSSSSPMEVVKKMSLPESAKDLDARSMPRVLSDNLFVESTSGLTEQEVRSAVSTWLSVEDDEEVLREEIELEMEEVTENMSRVHVEDDVSSEEEDPDGRQESCMTSIRFQRPRFALVSRMSAPICTRTEETASTAKRCTFFRRLCIRSLMKLKSSEERRRGVRCRRLFGMCGRRSFWCLRTTHLAAHIHCLGFFCLSRGVKFWHFLFCVFASC
ncbi:unnamed protein product [Ectocarpus sp. CCAP 1310/34]|nr:unnamed protein product [Ectocarpus sp. CCAP 1310/34]